MLSYPTSICSRFITELPTLYNNKYFKIVILFMAFSVVKKIQNIPTEIHSTLILEILAAIKK